MTKIIQNVNKQELIVNNTGNVIFENCNIDFLIVTAEKVTFVDTYVRKLSIHNAMIRNNVNCGSEVVQFCNCMGSIKTNSKRVEVFGTKLIVEDAKTIYYYYKNGDKNIHVFNDYPMLKKLYIDNEFNNAPVHEINSGIDVTICDLNNQ